MDLHNNTHTQPLLSDETIKMSVISPKTFNAPWLFKIWDEATHWLVDLWSLKSAFVATTVSFCLIQTCSYFVFRPSPPTGGRTWAPLPGPGCVRVFFLLKVSFSFPLLPAACSVVYCLYLTVCAADKYGMCMCNYVMLSCQYDPKIGGTFPELCWIYAKTN